MYHNETQQVEQSDNRSYSIAVILIMYLCIFLLGLYASWKSEFWKNQRSLEDIMLARRSIGLFMGVCTLSGKGLSIK